MGKKNARRQGKILFPSPRVSKGCVLGDNEKSGCSRGGRRKEVGEGIKSWGEEQTHFQSAFLDASRCCSYYYYLFVVVLPFLNKKKALIFFSERGKREFCQPHLR